MKRVFISFLKKIINIYYRLVNFLNFNINNVDVGKKVVVNGNIIIKNKGEIKIGNDIIINSKYSYNPIGGQGRTSFLVKKEGSLMIDDGARISNVAICAFESVYIGKNVYIGGGCKIYDTDFHSIRFEHRTSTVDNDIKSKRVVLNEGCFIGAHSIILKGVTIGKYSVIGAGSVVTKDIPDNEIWGGNPAKFIKKVN